MLNSIREILVKDWRSTRWKLFGAIYAITFGALIYFFSSYEMWYLSASLGLTATVAAILLLAALVTKFHQPWTGFGCSCRRMDNCPRIDARVDS